MIWDSVTWQDFFRALEEYRDGEYVGRSRNAGENAYLNVFQELADVPIRERGTHADSVIQFLNVWACRFPTKTPQTRLALCEWLSRESDCLDALSQVTVLNSDFPQHREECERLYESLIALKTTEGPSIPTMGDAAASKILHIMVPPLFVMWDKQIRKGWRYYSDFLLRMHDVACRLRDELAPEEAREDIEGYLQRALGYPVRKPLAKYLDEYNWWLAWGHSDLAVV